MATGETKGDVNVRIGVDDSPFVAGLRRIEDTLSDSATEWASRLNLAEAAWSGMATATRASVGAAIEAEVVEQRLTSALRQRGIETRNVLERLSTYNAAMSISTGIGDEDLVTIQSTLVALGAKTDALEKATSATLGLAEITGQGHAEAARTVAKVLNGNIEVLQRYGLEVTGVNSAMDLLASKQALVADRANTTQGRLDKLTNSAGEAAEAFGNLILGKGSDAPGWFDRVLDRANYTTIGLGQFIEKGQGVTNWATAYKAGGNQPIWDVVRFFEELGKEATTAAAALEKTRSEDFDLTGMGGVRVANMSLSGQDLREGEADRKRKAAEAVRARAAAEREAEREYQNRLTDYTPGQFVGPVDPDTRNFQQADQAQRQAAIRTEIQDLETHKSLQTAANEERFQAQLDIHTRLQEDARAHNEAVQRTADAGYSGLMSAATGFGAGFAQVVGQAAAGKVKFGEAMKALAGESIVSLGMMLFQLGTAGILAGTLGTFIPFFATLTGGPLGVAAGSAAAIAGLGMIALGSALGASSSPSTSSIGGGGGGGGQVRGGRPPSTGAPASELFPRSSLFGGVGEGQGTILQLNIYGGFFGGDSRGVARDIRDVVNDRSLIPTRRRGLAS